jgi:hypothetical protein
MRTTGMLTPINTTLMTPSACSAEDHEGLKPLPVQGCKSDPMYHTKKVTIAAAGTILTRHPCK